MNIETRSRKIADIMGEAVVHSTLKKMAQFEMGKCQQKMEHLKKELAPFEERFGMESRNAWTAYQSGKLGDDGDIMEWMMLFENFLALRRQYEPIREAGV
ncbi:hypothetical protein [Desulfonema magnum]|uniref:Uncharacterized protein n=1 Tax=Desulfonema magnum TaxID=45655 RepID=A0A975GV13_9BACT|nr:hypothetical protein [Desulfonema magnum]QTA93298.1 Uncharacterized protein dnm_093990 [Desulfonema magnum]